MTCHASWYRLEGESQRDGGRNGGNIRRFKNIRKREYAVNTAIKGGVDEECRNCG